MPESTGQPEASLLPDASGSPLPTRELLLEHLDPSPELLDAILGETTVFGPSDHAVAYPDQRCELLDAVAENVLVDPKLAPYPDAHLPMPRPTQAR